MSGSIALAVIGGAVAAFVLSGLYYTIFERRLSVVQQVGTPGESSPWVYAAEFVRSLVISTVLAGIAYFAGVTSWVGGLVLATTVWVGFPLMLWLGAVIHEKTDMRLAAIHAGDWLLKLATIGVIVGAWA